MKKIASYGTQMSKKMKGKVEKLGLPSNKQIANSVYVKLRKKK
tara:strand:- start:1965 stop:2093 length:129 start_codon:yes stop_codon:yes gene_type:complete